MKKVILIFAIVLVCFSACTHLNVDGTYSGLIEICSVDSSGKKQCFIDSNRLNAKWYHQSFIKIKGDSVYLDQNPVSVENNDTLSSTSDGAFYYYKGTINRTGENFTINLKEVACDYCAQQVKFTKGEKIENVYRTITWHAKMSDSGLVANNILFKPTKITSRLMSETLAE